MLTVSLSGWKHLSSPEDEDRHVSHLQADIRVTKLENCHSHRSAD